MRLLIGDNPGVVVVAMDLESCIERAQALGNHLCAFEVALKESQFLGQGDEFDRKSVDVWFLYHQPSTGFEHPPEFNQTGTLISNVVVGIDDEDPTEASIRKREPLGLTPHSEQASFVLRFTKHLYGLVCNDDLIHLADQTLCNPPRTAACIQQPARRRQSTVRPNVIVLGGLNETIVVRCQFAEVIKNGQWFLRISSKSTALFVKKDHDFYQRQWMTQLGAFDGEDRGD